MIERTTTPPSPEIFKQFRAKFDLTQAAAADFFGVSASTWAVWESETGRPQMTARMLAAILVAEPKLLDLFLEPG